MTATAAFVAAAAPALLARLATRDLDAMVAAWIAAARTAWPTVTVDVDAFAAHVAARLPEDASAETVELVHTSDLWLTAACVAADPHALAAFDERYVAALGAVLGPMGLRDDQIDEIKQEVRTKLLLGDGERPRIAEYSGRADLRTWVRTTAVRAALDLVRRRRDAPLDDDALDATEALVDDPALAYLKQRYRADVKAAITDAIAALASRDRLLLKYQYIDGLGVDRIGELYGIHRATAARWLVAAREALTTRTHRLMVERLRVSRSELRGIASLVESQLELSMARILA
ncbi:MAG: sigma-70 family RNA polymerase sigma factor [Deltaproteobacteria bacterium]|nr:sigma-70 family RNA polymerase sigma factor [Deltaproteobacteria bacterium]